MLLDKIPTPYFTKNFKFKLNLGRETKDLKNRVHNTKSQKRFQRHDFQGKV